MAACTRTCILKKCFSSFTKSAPRKSSSARLPRNEIDSEGANSDSKTKSKPNWQEKRENTRYGHDLWRPKKRLTWYQIEHLRTLHHDQPDINTVELLADKFGISYQAVRRILRSKFVPTPETLERQDRQALRQREDRQALRQRTDRPSFKRRDDIHTQDFKWIDIDKRTDFKD